MLRYCPEFYNNELLYSRISRLKKHAMLGSGLLNSYIYGEDALTSLNFPSKVLSLIENGVLTRDNWLKVVLDNTNANYFFSVIDKDRLKKIFDSLLDPKAGSGRSIENLLGINRSGFTLSNIPKYCPMCNAESLSENGEFYWNCLHQIPDIKVCVTHQCFLEDCAYSPGKSDRKYPIIISDEESCPITVPRLCQNKMVLELAIVMVKMLRGEYFINRNYEQRAKQAGFTLGRFLYREKLEAAYNDFYKGADVQFNNLKISVFLDDKILNPTRHLLLDYFLSNCTPINIPSSVEYYKFWDRDYFGKGPWICLNPKCRHYEKPSIKQGEFKYDFKARRTIGLFKCKCGTCYLTSFLITNGLVQKTRVRILKSQRKLILKSKEQLREQMEKKRKQWIKFSKTGHLTRLQKRSVYWIKTWLKKNDNKWYLKQETKLKGIEDRKLLLLARKKIDKQLKIVEKVIQLYKIEKPYFRITITEIIRRTKIPKSTIEPKVLNYIEKKAESIEGFQIRRLYAVEKELIKKGETITTLKLLYTAYVWKRSKAVMKIANEIASRH